MYKHDCKTTQEPSFRGHCGYREGRDFSMECANVSHIYLYVTKFFFLITAFLAFTDKFFYYEYIWTSSLCSTLLLNFSSPCKLYTVLK